MPPKKRSTIATELRSPTDTTPLLSQTPMQKTEEWFPGFVRQTVFLSKGTPVQKLMQALPFLGISLVTAIGAIAGAEECGKTLISDMIGATGQSREAVGYILGCASFLATSCVNLTYIKRNIAHASTFPLERHAALSWSCALAATSPAVVLGLLAMKGSSLYMQILISILSTMANTMVSKSGMLKLIDRTKALAETVKAAGPDAKLSMLDRENLLAIVGQANTRLQSFSPEEQRQWFDEVVEMVGRPKDYQFSQALEEKIFKHADLSARTTDQHDSLALVIPAWFLSTMSVAGNSYFFADTFMGAAGNIIAPIVSLPNLALMAEENIVFIKEDLAGLSKLPAWHRQSSGKELAVDTSTALLAALLATLGSANAAGIAYQAFTYWFSALAPETTHAIGVAAASFAATGTFGVNFRSVRGVLKSLSRETPLDDMLYAVAEAIKAAPPSVTEELMRTETMQKKEASDPRYAAPGLRRRHVSSSDEA